MDLVNKSGKYSQKFNGFTGKHFTNVVALAYSANLTEPFMCLCSNWFSGHVKMIVSIFVFPAGTSDPLGKKLNNSKTRAELGWEPKYPSFAQFLGVSE